MKTRLISTLFVFFTSVSLLLADAKIKFTTNTHDFGTIQEKDGDVTAKFEFTNTGDSPLLITRATATCGCTTPEHPKKPLRPGEKGEIVVTYHAKGRPGPFDKSIYVYSNDAKNEKVLLTITGNVVSATGVRETFTEELGGGLRVKTLSLNFFDVYPGRNNRTRTLAVYNEGDTPMTLTYRNVPNHIHIDCDPEVIEPKQQGRVLVTFVINKDGAIVEGEVIKSVDPLLDAEALRVVNAMPAWIPGTQKGKPVRVKYTIPVNFRLSVEEKPAE